MAVPCAGTHPKFKGCVFTETRKGRDFTALPGPAQQAREGAAGFHAFEAPCKQGQQDLGGEGNRVGGMGGLDAPWS